MQLAACPRFLVYVFLFSAAAGGTTTAAAAATTESSKDSNFTPSSLTVENNLKDYTIEWQIDGPFQYNISLPKAFNGTSTIYPDFNPPLYTAPTHKIPRLVTLMVDNWKFLPLALNCLVSLKRIGISNITIFCPRGKMSTFLYDLGYYVYDDGDPEMLKYIPDVLKIPLPHWSWGTVLVRRIRIWFATVQRNLGLCTVDADTVFDSGILFSSPADIVLQGHEGQPGTPGKTEKCRMTGSHWELGASLHSPRTYINPGVMCYSPSQSLAKFFTVYSHALDQAIKQKTYGYIQPAFNRAICNQGFRVMPTLYNKTQEIDARVDDLNLTMKLIEADHIPSTNKHHFYHAKDCHQNRRASAEVEAEARSNCKVNLLKNAQKWLLPDNIEPFLHRIMASKGNDIVALNNFITIWKSTVL